MAKKENSTLTKCAVGTILEIVVTCNLISEIGSYYDYPLLHLTISVIDVILLIGIPIYLFNEIRK
jgi:hypothetical protein